MSERYAIVIPTTGNAIILHCDDGEGMELESLQGLVEGHIEILPCFLDRSFAKESKPTRLILIINEEGKLLGLDHNEKATLISYVRLNNDHIVGNAILMGTKGEDIVGFTHAECEHIIKEWRL